MKKLKLILTALILFSLNSLAVEDNVADYRIIKNNGLFGIENKSVNEITVPCEYKKIVELAPNIYKVKSQNKKWKIITANNEIFLDGEFNKVKKTEISDPKNNINDTVFFGIYNKKKKITYIKALKYTTDDFLNNIYEQNNRLSWIKFKNYPTEATIVLKKNNKYGYLSAKDDVFIYVPPKYKNIYIQDNLSTIYKTMGISFADIKNIKVYDGYYWFHINDHGRIQNKTSYLTRFAVSPSLEEDINIKNDELTFTYKSQSDLFNNLSLSGFPNRKDENFAVGKIDWNKKNYMEISKEKLNIYKNKKTYSILRSNYDDFYFPDKNSVIYNIKRVSFSNPDRIFAKKGNLWGIIDKDENVIADFQYEDIMGIAPKEVIDIKENNKKYDLNYKKVIPPKNKIFIVKKEGKYSVIDENGQTLIPYKEIINKEEFKKTVDITKRSIKKILKRENINPKNPTIPYSKVKTAGVLIRFPFAYSSPIISPFILSLPDLNITKKMFKRLF